MSMKIKAVGRYIHIRVDFDMIEALQNDLTIALPPEYIEKLKGGCQIATILSMGASAFDDFAPSELEMIKPGMQIITGRYPGHEVDLDPKAGDKEVNREKLISCDEVHAIVPEEDSDG